MGSGNGKLSSLIICYNIFMTILLFLFGLVIGSFLSAITWRLPRGVDFVSDRSKCDRCGALIYWYDNIPLFSYLILGGKCRNCSKNISIRYPLMEFSTAVIFVSIFSVVTKCMVNIGGPTSDLPVCDLTVGLGSAALPYLLLVAATMIAIFVTDFELQIIPDEFVFMLLGLNLILFPLFFGESLYMRLFSGFSASLFLLLLHIFTKGRGMGLGDVKLALFAGSFFGLKNTISWLFLSFILGALIGLILIIAGKAKFGRKIAFGPFLVISFFLILFWGDRITSVLTPYLN
jgi:leader peptidase (prepilin peptidase) / N-methyltransferase